MENRSGIRGVGVLLVAVLMALVMLLGLALGVVAVRVFPLWNNEPPKIRDTSTVLVEIQGLNQLVTVRYVLEKVVILEDVKWYGENRVLMVAHGIAKAGVDLSKLKDSDIIVRGTTVKIKLPKPQLLDVYLDERKTEIVERSTGLLRTFDKDLEQDARRQAVDKIRTAAYDSGILKDALERARTQLSMIFRRIGYESIEFE
ncbi:MAG TPA: DUF4230 domain-containing protein [Candidatus Limnocylindria bacterium]|nr:DUF4230 domain-containing protein [Candidatus Limnocylindria bacterium]